MLVTLFGMVILVSDGEFSNAEFQWSPDHCPVDRGEAAGSRVVEGRRSDAGDTGGNRQARETRRVLECVLVDRLDAGAEVEGRQFVAPRNAWFPIVVTLLPIVTLVMVVASPNAAVLICSTSRTVPPSLMVSG